MRALPVGLARIQLIDQMPYTSAATAQTSAKTSAYDMTIPSKMWQGFLIRAAYGGLRNPLAGPVDPWHPLRPPRLEGAAAVRRGAVPGKRAILPALGGESRADPVRARSSRRGRAAQEPDGRLQRVRRAFANQRSNPVASFFATATFLSRT